MVKFVVGGGPRTCSTLRGPFVGLYAWYGLQYRVERRGVSSQGLHFGAEVLRACSPPKDPCVLVTGLPFWATLAPRERVVDVVSFATCPAVPRTGFGNVDEYQVPPLELLLISNRCRIRVSNVLCEVYPRYVRRVVFRMGRRSKCLVTQASPREQVLVPNCDGAVSANFAGDLLYGVGSLVVPTFHDHAEVCGEGAPGNFNDIKRYLSRFGSPGEVNQG